MANRTKQGTLSGTPVTITFSGRVTSIRVRNSGAPGTDPDITVNQPELLGSDPDILSAGESELYQLQCGPTESISSITINGASGGKYRVAVVSGGRA